MEDVEEVRSPRSPRRRVEELPVDTLGVISGFLPGSSLRNTSSLFRNVENIDYVRRKTIENIERMYPGLKEKREDALKELGEGDIHALMYYLTEVPLTWSQRAAVAMGTASKGRYYLTLDLVDTQGKTTLKPLNAHKSGNM